MTIKDAEMKQDEFNATLNDLNNYFQRSKKYIEERKNLLDNAENFYEVREKTIERFKERIFLLNHNDEFKEQAKHKK